jgi:hypothetical protein
LEQFHLRLVCWQTWVWACCCLSCFWNNLVGSNALYSSCLVLCSSFVSLEQYFDGNDSIRDWFIDKIEWVRVCYSCMICVLTVLVDCKVLHSMGISKLQLLCLFKTMNLQEISLVQHLSKSVTFPVLTHWMRMMPVDPSERLDIIFHFMMLASRAAYKTIDELATS